MNKFYIGFATTTDMLRTATTDKKYPQSKLFCLWLHQEPSQLFIQGQKIPFSAVPYSTIYV